MALHEFEKISPKEAFRRYPIVDKWLTDPTDLTVQVSENGEQLFPSAMEVLQDAYPMDPIIPLLGDEIAKESYGPVILFMAETSPTTVPAVYEGVVQGLRLPDSKHMLDDINTAADQLLTQKLVQPTVQQIVFLRKSLLNPGSIGVSQLIGIQATPEGAGELQSLRFSQIRIDERRSAGGRARGQHRRTNKRG
jgi:hypothetical protein